ncbi:Protein SCAR2 [Linum perenne]
MPLTRYQIRNEYGLADPELYKSADRDDPEALLEGVAMAGLVGVLRQLGDLAEFAAEIFHNLHEEVMTTAARGHSLMARVQQLEADVPSVEKAFLSQTDHSSFFTNGGVDWRPNLHMEQNLITHGDLPRFVMDSYEECRGPPRLFLLDKFDVAGAGACLKRYTDPSIFKVEAPTSTTMEAQREKKARKMKKKGTRWRNGETPDVTPASHAKLHQLFLEERVANGHSDPARLVKLKRRQLNGSPFNMKSGKSYMEKFLQTPSPDNKAVCEVSVNPPLLSLTQDNYSESGLEIVEIPVVSPTKQLSKDERSYCSTPDVQDNVPEHLHDDLKGTDTDKWIVKVADIVADCETDESPVHNMSIGKELTIYAGGRTDSLNEDHSDDMISEVDNYMDALATMESEIESDNEYKSKANGALKWVSRQAQSNVKDEPPVIEAKFLNSQSYGNSSVSDDGNSSLYKGGSSLSYTDSLSNVAENVQSDGEGPSKVCHSTEDGVVVASILQYDNPSPQLGTHSRELEDSANICLEEEKNQEPERVSAGPDTESQISDPVMTVHVADYSVDSLAEKHSDERIHDKEVASESGAVDLETNENLEDSSVASSDIPCQIKPGAPATIHAESNSVDDLEQEDPKASPTSASYVSDLDHVQSSHDDSIHDMYKTSYSNDTGNIVLEENGFPHLATSQEVELHSGELLSEKTDQLASEVDNLVEATDVTDSSDTLKKDSMLSGFQSTEVSLLNNPQEAKLEEMVIVSDAEYMSKDMFSRHLDAASRDTIVSEHSYEYYGESGRQEPANLNDIATETVQTKDVIASITSDIDGHANENLYPSSDSISSPSTQHIGMQESFTIDDQHQTALNLRHKISTEAYPEAGADEEVIPKGTGLNRGESSFCEPDAVVHVHHAASVEQQDNMSVVGVSTEHPSGINGSVLEWQLDNTSAEISEDDGCVPISHLPKEGTPGMSPVLLDDQNNTESIQVDEGTSETEDITKYASHLEQTLSHPSSITESRTPSEQAWGLQPDQTDESCLEPDKADSSSSNILFPNKQTVPPVHKRNLDGPFMTSVVNPSSHEPLLPSNQDLQGIKPAGNTFDFTPNGLGALSSTKDVSGDEMPPMPPLPPMQWRMGKFPTASQSLQTGCIDLGNLPMQQCAADERATLGLDREIMQSLSQCLSNNIEDGHKVPGLPMDSTGISLQPNPLPFELQSVANTADMQKNSHSIEALGPLNPYLSSEEVSNSGLDISDRPSGDLKPTSPDSFPSMPSAGDTSSIADVVHSSQDQAELSFNGLASKPDPEPKLVEHCVESTGRGPVDAPEESLQVEMEQLHQNMVTSYGGTSWPPTLALPPSYELGKANGNKLPRPRNPLIDAVAAIDKSKLRKAAERVQPKEEERDTLLEQIRTKSFNLKPAAATRPSMRPGMPGIHGPKTNLKVAAILEKANAIRQALAGSDDEDDDDNWSDS